MPCRGLEGEQHIEIEIYIRRTRSSNDFPGFVDDGLRPGPSLRAQSAGADGTPS